MAVLLLGSCLALLGGRIFPSPRSPVIEDGTVVVCDGKIDALGDRSRVLVPETADRLDTKGLSIAFGFWNSHVHFTEPAFENAGALEAAALQSHIQEMLTRWGFTTVVDTGSNFTN